MNSCRLERLIIGILICLMLLQHDSGAQLGKTIKEVEDQWGKPISTPTIDGKKYFNFKKNEVSLTCILGKDGNIGTFSLFKNDKTPWNLKEISKYLSSSTEGKSWEKADFKSKDPQWKEVYGYPPHQTWEKIAFIRDLEQSKAGMKPELLITTIEFCQNWEQEKNTRTNN